jgi:CheY-like chemotaxis protein
MLLIKDKLVIKENVAFIIAEDDQGHFALAKHCIRSAGIPNEVQWCSDGQKTIDFIYSENGPIAKDDKHYILLLDIRMPKLDGIEVLEKINSNDKLNNISVIMLTASNDQKEIQRSYELGCNAHIVKPPGESLIKAIQRVNQLL